MFTTPEDNPVQNTSEVIINEDNKSHRTILYVVGAFLVLIILWGAAQIKSTSVTVNVVEEVVVTPTENTLSEEEMIRRQLELLAAESENQPPATEAEIQAQLELLAAEEGTTVQPTEEEIRAQLEALAAEAN